MRSHNLEHKPSKQKRKFRKEVEVTSADYRALKKMLRIKS
jgi:ribosomal protein L35